MRVGLTVAAVLVLLAGTALADPFTGRYLVDPTDDIDGGSLEGFIDLAGVPMGATSFALSSAVDFSFTVTGPSGGVIMWDHGDGIGIDGSFGFDGPIGSQELAPVGAPSTWQSPFVDLGGLGPAADQITLVAFGDWRSVDQDRTPIVIGRTWKLVLAGGSAPVPEPGTLFLSGLAVAGALVWRRRQGKA